MKRVHSKILAIAQSEGGRGSSRRRTATVIVSCGTVAEGRRRTSKLEERQFVGWWLPCGCDAAQEAKRTMEGESGERLKMGTGGRPGVSRGVGVRWDEGEV